MEKVVAYAATFPNTIIPLPSPIKTVAALSGQSNKGFGMSNANVSELVSLVQYMEQRRSIFPSESAIRWFLRLHRAELINSGALLTIARRYLVDIDKFDACVMKVGADAAQKRLASWG